MFRLNQAQWLKSHYQPYGTQLCFKEWDGIMEFKMLIVTSNFLRHHCQPIAHQPPQSKHLTQTEIYTIVKGL